MLLRTNIMLVEDDLPLRYNRIILVVFISFTKSFIGQLSSKYLWIVYISSKLRGSVYCVFHFYVLQAAHVWFVTSIWHFGLSYFKILHLFQITFAVSTPSLTTYIPIQAAENTPKIIVRLILIMLGIRALRDESPQRLVSRTHLYF